MSFIQRRSLSRLVIPHNELDELYVASHCNCDLDTIFVDFDVQNAVNIGFIAFSQQFTWLE